MKVLREVTYNLKLTQEERSMLIDILKFCRDSDDREYYSDFADDIVNALWEDETE